MDEDRSFPAVVSSWLWRLFEGPRVQWWTIPAIIGVVIVYILLFSGLPPRIGWIAEALTGAALTSLLLWRSRRRNWFRHGLGVNVIGSVAGFMRFGDYPFDDRPPVIFLVALGWGMGFMALRFLHNRVPTTKAGRQTEIILLLFGLLVTSIAAGVSYLFVTDREARQVGLQLKSQYSTVRSASSIEQCLTQTPLQRKIGGRRHRFDYSPEHPDRRSYFDTVPDRRWTVIDEGDRRLVFLELKPSQSLTNGLNEEAHYCTTPIVRIDLYGNVK